MASLQRSKKVCLITTGHISSNPRLVKEAVALSKAGIHVHIIFTQYVDYLVEYDSRILQLHPEWTYNALNWTGFSLSSKINGLLSGLRQRISSQNEIKLNRHFKWQLRKATNCKANLYIAHNLGALPVVVQTAKINMVKCGFDAEDFHRNEVTDNAYDSDVVLKTAIEDVYISQLDYMTAASPLIAKAYSTLYQREVTPILNVFPQRALPVAQSNTNAPLQLFWFSQTVGPDRGLEIIIEGLDNCSFPTNLHLLGKVTTEYKKNLLNLVRNSSLTITFHNPVFPDELFQLAAQFDIGFATEPSQPLNRDICLTNKIFTYLQCGLTIMASSTQAQTAFLKQYHQAGCIHHSAHELTAMLTYYHNNREALYQAKLNAYELGQTQLNWDIESKKWLTVIQTVLN